MVNADVMTLIKFCLISGIQSATKNVFLMSFPTIEILERNPHTFSEEIRSWHQGLRANFLLRQR